MKQIIMATVMAAAVLMQAGCASFSGLAQHNERVVHFGVSGKTPLIGVDVLAMQRGWSGYWAEDKLGMATRIGLDTAGLVAILAGTAALYNDYQDDRESPGREESASSDKEQQDQSADGQNGGSADNGGTGGDSTTINGDGNTVIINKAFLRSIFGTFMKLFR